MNHSHTDAFRIGAVNVVIADRSGRNTLYAIFVPAVDHFAVDHCGNDIDHVIALCQIKIFHAGRFLRISPLNIIFLTKALKIRQLVKVTHTVNK